MKTNIDMNGTLHVEAETELEHYALKKWFDDWRDKKVSLHIEICKYDGTKKVLDVPNDDIINPPSDG